MESNIYIRVVHTHIYRYAENRVVVSEVAGGKVREMNELFLSFFVV